MPRKVKSDTRIEMFNRVAAARCYVDRAIRNPVTQEQAELSAFMAIFHPEVPDDKVRQMVRDVKYKN